MKIMFTGIIKETVKVKEIKTRKNGAVLKLVRPKFKTDIGQSLAVNGVCSTVVKTHPYLQFEYMPETLKCSNINRLKKNDFVNLEPSLKFGATLDGHLVLGHVDAVGKILSVKTEGNSRVFRITIPSGFKKYLMPKGSITVEGVALTVVGARQNFFTVKIIPYTLRHTNLIWKKMENKVNLEFDILAKYLYARK